MLKSLIPGILCDTMRYKVVLTYLLRGLRAEPAMKPATDTSDLSNQPPSGGVLRVGGASPGGTNAEETNTEGLKVFQPDNPILALGLAVSYLMTIPPFRDLKFGDWSRILTGQINRKDYLFVIRDGEVEGFCGWASTDRDRAEAWLDGHADEFENMEDGDSLIINAWEAASSEVNNFMRAEMRKIGKNKVMVYAKRVFEDGSVRPVRLKVNQFVNGHIEVQDM